MEIKVEAGDIVQHPAKAIIVNLFEGVRSPGGATGALDEALGGGIGQLMAEGEIKGKKGELTLVHTLGRLPSPRILVAGLGEQSAFNTGSVRDLTGASLRRLRGAGASSVATILHGAGIAGLEPQACAQAIAEGAVMGSYRFTRHKQNDEDAKEIESLGVRAMPVRTDVTDEESVRAMVQATLAEFGRIDILINNAGVMSPGRLWEIPAKRWDLVMRVNVRGPVICCQAVLPHMIERRDGVVINISSIAADQVGEGNVSYSVTKQALRKLSEGLAEEVKEHNIRVFSLSPEGLVITPGTMYHRLDEQVPAGPLVEPPDAMGKAAVFLCGDEAKSLVGQHFYSRPLLRERGLWDEPAESDRAT